MEKEKSIEWQRLKSRQLLIESKLKTLTEMERMDHHKLMAIPIARMTDELIDEQIAVVKDLIRYKTPAKTQDDGDNSAK